MKLSLFLHIGLLTGLLGAVAAADLAPKPVGPIPDVLLRDQDNASFQFHSLKGKHVWVSFLYTHCPLPGACPTTVLMAKHLGRWWKKRLAWIPLQEVMITMDPARDNPAELRKFAEKRGVTFDGFKLATGRQEDIDSLKKAFGVNGAAASDGNFYHDSQSFLLGPDLNVIRIYQENQWKPDDVICAVGVPLPECPKESRNER